MNYNKVIDHIQLILNSCGDNIKLTSTGNTVLSSNFIGKLSIEIEETFILKQNNCSVIAIPNPQSHKDTADRFCINRIRISTSLIDDYSKNYPLSNEQVKDFLTANQSLFGYY